MSKVVRVAVAIIVKPNGEYLLASRPNGKGWAGWWEFPGGKIEQAESPEQALSRELQEELGITPTQMQAWIKRCYDYPATHDADAKTVLLHFYFVQQWQGEPQALEGQILAWQHPQQLTVEPILPANAPIMQALALPAVYAISDAAGMGQQTFLEALQRQLDQGLQLLQISEPNYGSAQLQALTEKILTQCAHYSTKVLLNGNAALAMQTGVHGVHFNQQDLQDCQQRPALSLVGATCHHAQDLAKAAALKLDFVLLAPTFSQQSDNSQVIDWEQFGKLIEHYEVPVYALENNRQQLSKAQTHGARGIAMQRAYWQD